MNERILELMTKAGFDVEKLRMYPGGWPREDLLVLQDFAELIVGQCIRIGQETSKEIFKMSKTEGDIFEHKSHGAEEVVDNIKEHFGVEE